MGIKTKWGNKSNGRASYVFALSAFMLIFLMGFWLALSPPAYAVTALSYDGKDDFAYVAFEEGVTFNAMTLQVWIKPGTFDPGTESFAAWIRAVDQLPPLNGYTKTSYSKFLLHQDKSDWQKWHFQVTTDSGYFDIQADSTLGDPDQWYHIAVTYDGVTVTLYQDGENVGSGEVLGSIPDVFSMWFGRWVKAISGCIGMIVIHDRALDQEEIANSICGPPFEGLLAYWPLNEGSGDYVEDDLGNELVLGVYRAGDSYQPDWVDADYIKDSDGDGIADECDNCPTIPNADQANQDGDEFGNACDDCSMGDCDWVTETVVSEVTGLVPTIKFEWGDGDSDAPDAYMVPQDCENTIVVCYDLDGNPLHAKCQRPASYMLTVGEFSDGEGGYVSGVPGGDLVLYVEGDSTTIHCDLLKWYDLEDFANGAQCYAVHIASTYDRNYDWATGDCSRPPCVEPDSDFPYGKEFVGKATSNSFDIEPTIAVPVNIKHTSFPNSINLSGGGVITVGIYTTDDLDATLVDPSTVRLGDRLSGVFSTCPPCKSETGDLDTTLCGDPGDIGACNPDSRPDLLLHFEELCLPFTEDLEVTVSGQTFGETKIMGTDTLIVR